MTGPSDNGALTTEQHKAAEAFAKYWPDDGERNNAALALCGGLARAGWPAERIEAFVGEVAERAGDEEARRRASSAKSTVDKFMAGEPVMGWTKLKSFLGQRGDDAVRALISELRLNRGVTLAELAEDKKLPVEYLMSLGLHDLPGGSVGIPYRGTNANPVVKRRTALSARDGSYWPEGVPPVAYGEDRLGESAAHGFQVVVDGESDCWTLWFQGFPGVGLPGANTVKKTLALGHVGAVRRVYVVREPDQGEEGFAAKVRDRLAELGWSGDLRVIKLDGCKDPNALHQQYPDHEEFREHFQEALDRAEVLPMPTAAAVCLNDVWPQRVDWLWEGRIPFGTITLLDGDPGLGKSFLTLEIAARASRGLSVPPDEGIRVSEPIGVLLLNAEVDLARTIRPRLDACGADLARIHALPDLPDGTTLRPPVLPDDLDTIERLITQLGVKLVTFDPLMAFLSGKVDSHKDSDVRRILYRLKLMAERTQAAVVVVRHLNKLVNVRDPLYRGGGSIGIIGAARSALMVGNHPEDPENKRVLCRSKGNLSAEPPALAYEICNDNGVVRVKWHGEVSFTAADLLGKQVPKRQAQGDALDEAIAFLQDALRNEPQKTDEVRANAADRDIALRTLERAKKEMQVRSFSKGFNPKTWYWELPGEDRQADSAESPTANPPAGTDQPPATTENPGHATTLAVFDENPSVSRELPEDRQVEEYGGIRDFGGLREPSGGLQQEEVGADGRQGYAEDRQTAEDRQIRNGGSLRENSEKTSESAEDRQAVSCRALSEGNGQFTYVRDVNGLAAVRDAVRASASIGVDLETTGLDPRKDRPRLLSLATDRGTFLVDTFGVDPRHLFGPLADRTFVFHNGAFDLAFLAGLGFEPGKVKDTMLASQLLHGTRRPKGFHRLAQVAARELGRKLDKQLQKSDWSGELTREQLDYASLDVEALPPLLAALEKKLHAAGLDGVADIEHRCLPAVLWLARSGIAFDRAAWDALTVEADAEAFRLGKDLDDAAPAPPDDRRGMFNGWNWDSAEQVKEAFAAAGVLLKSTDDEALAGVAHPMAGLLRSYRAAKKRSSTYGQKWLNHVASNGRVYAGWRQIGADSGRMSCSGPNLQNLPRDKCYRKCFVAPPGRVLVKADYSQIELRIAAKVSGDQAMLDAYRKGEDMHALTARRVLGTKTVTKEQRQLAKAVNFGLIYGMGAKGFRDYAKSNYGVKLTDAQAAEYRRTFFRTYPGLEKWHRAVKHRHVGETRTLAGRRRLLDVKDSDTLRLNSPVQGTGADGLKLAMALLWERRGQVSGAIPVLAVHDEIVVECDTGDVDAAKEWLREAMLDGMRDLLDPVPVKVELTAARTWGG
jgi:DNA polymerase-1